MTEHPHSTNLDHATLDECIQAFDAVWTRLVSVQARIAKGGLPDREMDMLVAEEAAFTWSIIKMQAVLDRQVGDKLDLLRELITDHHWTDGRHLALLESIRQDVT